MAEWTAAYVNDLPDSAFACIDEGGEKDEQGRTTPRSLRHYPHHDATGAVDDPHLANARARVAQQGTTSCGYDHLVNDHRLLSDQRSEELEDFAYMDYMGPRLRALFEDDQPTINIRAEGDGPPTIFGHLAVFDSPGRVDSAVEGQFIERIARGSFKKTIQENRRSIQVLYDHGKDPRFGRRPIAKLTELREDERGVYYEAEVLDTADNRDSLLPSLRAGVLGTSFTFRPTKRPQISHPARASAENPDAWPEVTVTELAMREFGPTPFPVYQDTAVGLRSVTDEYLIAQLASDPEHLRALLTSIGVALPKPEPAAATPPPVAAPAPPRRFHSTQEFMEWISSN